MKNYLWNMFAIIKNGQAINKSFIFYPKKKFCASFLNILWDEGFILGYKISKTNPEIFKIFLKYKNGNPVIKSLKVITKPGCRIYYSIEQLWKIDSSKGILILSTNKGLLSINECKKLKIGGEPFLIIN
jgi:small subunit ribosomal protein S8